MAEYSPTAISAASTTFKQYLLSTETGTAVWEMLRKPGVGSSLQMDWFTPTASLKRAAETTLKHCKHRLTLIV
jgi:hypothetical protein